MNEYKQLIDDISKLPIDELDINIKFADNINIDIRNSILKVVDDNNQFLKNVYDKMLKEQLDYMVRGYYQNYKELKLELSLGKE